MKDKTKKIVMLGVLTAMVVVLQFVSMALRFGTFSITLTLVPIVVGAALYGKWAGAWLGGVFGLAVLLTGDANLFLGIMSMNEETSSVNYFWSNIVAADFWKNIVETHVLTRFIGTVAVVMLKGILSGFISGLFYDILKKKNDTIAAYVAGIVAPIVNTGTFIVGCVAVRPLFNFIKDLADGAPVFKFIIIALVGFNFFIELGVNVVLSPTIARIIKISRKELK